MINSDDEVDRMGAVFRRACKGPTDQRTIKEIVQSDAGRISENDVSLVNKEGSLVQAPLNKIE